MRAEDSQFAENTLELLSSAAERGVATIDISVRLKIKENTNHPYDLHPSPFAHRQYAEKLRAFLEATTLEQ